MPGPHYRETWVDDTNVNKTTLRNGMRDQTALLVTVAELQAMDTAAHRFAVVKTGTGEVAVFEYDAADTTTADNGTTVLVSNDGNRFKRNNIYSAQVDYSIDVQKDDADVLTGISELNFEGAGVEVADDGSGKATVTIAGGGGGGGGGSSLTAGGRLTLSSGTPDMIAAVVGATTIYYTPYVGQLAPIYDGSAFSVEDFGGELSQATTDTTKSPAAVTTNSNYDMFVWDDGGTYRCTRGPAWFSATDRGAGAGTTELEQIEGVWLNKIDIVNGPSARRGTYVGTIRTNSSSGVDWSSGSAAVGGGAAFFGVFNAYNQIDHAACVQDTTVNWVYGTGAFRASNNSAGNRISFVNGLGVGRVMAINAQRIQSTANWGSISIGLDSTTSKAEKAHRGFAIGNNDGTVYAHFFAQTGLGFHYLQSIELASGPVTYVGNVNDFALMARWRG